MPILETVSTKIDQEEGRSSRFKMKKRIVVGNLSKYVHLAISKVLTVSNIGIFSILSALDIQTLLPGFYNKKCN
jgi:hypothetical protein